MEKLAGLESALATVPVVEVVEALSGDRFNRLLGHLIRVFEHRPASLVGRSVGTSIEVIAGILGIFSTGAGARVCRSCGRGRAVAGRDRDHRPSYLANEQDWAKGLA